MIQAIGIMIGAYIFTRMIEMLTSKTHGAVKFFAVTTILITSFATLAIFAFRMPAGL